MKRTGILLIGMMATTVALAQVENGLVASYSFDNGDATDGVGSVDGQPINAIPATDRFGNGGMAMAFASDDSSRIDLGDSFDAVITGPGATFSLSFWIWVEDSSVTNTRSVFTKYGNISCNQDQREFSLYYTEAKVLSWVYYGDLATSNYREVLGSSLLNDSTWYHIVVTYDGNLNGNDGLDRVVIYVDAIAELTTLGLTAGSLASIPDGAAHMSLGAPIGAGGVFCEFPGNTFSGRIDDVRIYDRVLSPIEVDSLTNAQNPTLGNGPASRHSPLRVFPVPAKDQVQLAGVEMDRSSEVLILNATGQVVERYPGGARVLDIGALAPGPYQVMITHRDGTRMVARLVKE